MFTPIRLATAAAVYLALVYPARAIAFPAPINCPGVTRVKPIAGSTIPANLPAFVLWPIKYYDGRTKLIADYQIELRDGTGALIPTVIEAQQSANTFEDSGRESPPVHLPLHFLQAPDTGDRRVSD